MESYELSSASREIMWNMHSPVAVVFLYGLLAVATAIGMAGVWRRIELWSSGKTPADAPVSWIERFMAMFDHAAMQRGVVRDNAAAVFHTLIYLGFVVLLFTTTMVFLDHDLGLHIYHGPFYLAVTIASDIFGIGLLLGVGLAAYRREILRADKLHRRWSEHAVLIALGLLVLQGYVLEGLRIHVTEDRWASFSPVGLLFAKFFWGLTPSVARGLHAFTWWFHTLTVYTCIAALPYTKFFHIVASSANLYFAPRTRPLGALSYPGDIEVAMEKGDEISFGLQSIKDYSTKQLLDLDACTSCGRCQEACPAYKSGKPLSPKWLMLDTRNHALTLHAQGLINTESLLPSGAVKVDRALTSGFLATASAGRAGEFRANNLGTQNSVRAVGGDPEARIAGTVMDEDVFWSCTTCMACVEACPVGINHVDHIVENRRNMVLMHGEVPSEAQATLRKLENQGNPFGDPDARMNWATDLQLRTLKPGDSVEYLYWVGCLSAFDPRKQKIARAMVKLLTSAGIDFAVLGKSESCTGDPARRLGEENLFQSLAKKNVATLQNVSFKFLVANCPHCFNTIKNEYPQFGGIAKPQAAQPEVIHHTVLLERLLKQGALKVHESAKSYTFHDPCYLGRYNNEYDAPREALVAIGQHNLKEMTASRNKAMCCGAGGGHYWHDMKVGTRVNVIRTDQAAETGAERVATGCPFCLHMMEDGVKLTNRESSLEVRDIAEVLVENLM